MSSLSYPMQVVSAGGSPVSMIVPAVNSSLPLGEVGDFVILLSDRDRYPTGLYTKTVVGWISLLHQNDLCAAAIYGGHLTIYMNTTSTIPVPDGVLLYKNGNPQSGGTSITPGPDIWITSVVASGSGGGGFVNPMTALGDLIKGGAAGAAARLGVGAEGQVLSVVGGQPAWAPGGGGSGGEPLANAIFDNNLLIPAAGQSYIVDQFPSWILAMPACDVLVAGVAQHIPAQNITLTHSNGEANWFFDIDTSGNINVVSDKVAPAGTFPQAPGTFRLVQVQVYDTVNGAGYATFVPITPGNADLLIKHTSLGLCTIDSTGKLQTVVGLSAGILVGSVATGDATSYLSLTLPNLSNPALPVLQYQWDYVAANQVAKIILGTQFLANSIGLGPTTRHQMNTAGENYVLPAATPNADIWCSQPGCSVDVMNLTLADSPIIGVSGWNSSVPFDVVRNGTTYIGTVQPGEGAIVFGHGNGKYGLLSSSSKPATVQVKQGDPANAYAGNMFVVDRSKGANFVLNIERTPATIQYAAGPQPQIGDKLHFIAKVVDGYPDNATITWNQAVDGFYFDPRSTVAPDFTINTSFGTYTWSAEYVGINFNGPSYKVNYHYGENPPRSLQADMTVGLTIPGMTISADAYMKLYRLDGGRLAGGCRLKGTVTDSTKTSITMTGFMPSTVPMEFRSQPTVNALGIGISGKIAVNSIVLGTGVLPTNGYMLFSSPGGVDTVSLVIDKPGTFGAQVGLGGPGTNIGAVNGDVVDIAFSFESYIPGFLMT